MNRRANTSLMLILGASVAFFLVYAVSLYIAAQRSDLAADQQKERLINALLASYQDGVLEQIHHVASSDDAFLNVENERLLKSHLDPLCQSGKLGRMRTFGVVDYDGQLKFLCEYGIAKEPLEHSYLQPFLNTATKPLVAKYAAERGRRNGVLISSHFVTYDQTPYLFISANPSRQNLSSVTGSDNGRILFAMDNVGSLIKRATEDYAKVGDVSVTHKNDHQANYYIARLGTGDVGDTLWIKWHSNQTYRQQLKSLAPALVSITIALALMIFLNLNKIKQLHSELEYKEETARHAAAHDNLTGLPNRAHFGELVDDALHRATTLSPVFVGILDLDRFKTVNDSCGHHVGDALLQALSDRLRQILGEDNISARLGGDEFAFAIKNCATRKDAETLMAKLQTELRKEVHFDGNVIHPGASLGLAEAPLNSLSRTQLMKMADTALYQAKRNGRGRLSFYEMRQEEVTTPEKLSSEHSEFSESNLFKLPYKSFKHVLIVDDDPLQRQLLRAVFESFGSVTVSEADSGVTAKHAIEIAEVPFELIVLDLSMPEMDGFEFMDYLKHASTSSELLLMTGLPTHVIDMAHTLAKRQGLSVAGQLQKPISRVSVIRAFRERICN